MDNVMAPLPPLLLYGEQSTLSPGAVASEDEDLGKLYDPASQMLPAEIYADASTYDRMSTGSKERRMDKIRVD